MTEIQIQQIWTQINNVLDLQAPKFDVRMLINRRWYLQVLEIIFPQLGQNLLKIEQIQSQQAAIDRMLLLLTQAEIIQDDFLQIKGKDIVSGDVESIFYVVQLLYALVQKAIEEAEEEEMEDEEVLEQHKLINKEHGAPIGMNPHTPIVRPQARSEGGSERGRHSVQGIGHQFQDEEQDQEAQEDSFNHEYNKLQNQNQYNNVFPQTAYSSGPQPNVLPMHQEGEDEPQEYEQPYLQQKLNKHKSEEHFKKKSSKLPKKMRASQPKKVRKLVSHPQIPKQYPKARTAQQKQMTHVVKKTIDASKKETVKSDKENVMRKIAGSPQIQKKKRQFGHYIMDNKKISNKMDQRKKKVTNLQEKNSEKLKKLLKWKEAALSRQKLQLQEEMQNKLLSKKEQYIKKINKLILTLEKNRMIEKKKEQKELQRKEKELANKRLQAIEQQYRTQMKLLHEKSHEKVGKKPFNNTDHKSIIESLEKQLKKENEKQLMSMKMRMRREEVKLDDDLDRLQREIIKTYKKN